MKMIRVMFSAFLSGYITCSLEGATTDALKRAFTAAPIPFNYDLQIKILPGEKTESDVMICMHGMGGDSSLCGIMRANPAISYHLVAFNFPDHGSRSDSIPSTSFGSFDEIAPALFVLKKSIVDGGADRVHLYGFSAGGGAIINILAVLNSNFYDPALSKLGIGEAEKKKILQSIQLGSVLLEVPLKSFDEVADLSGNRDMKVLAERSRKNGMVPIENIKYLEGLSLNAFIYFANPDEALGNRDDDKFIQRLQAANKNGRTVSIAGRNASHLSYHPELWEAYKRS